MKKWKQNIKEIEKDANSRTHKRKRISSSAFVSRKKAKFDEEEAKVHKAYKARRAKGLIVDGEYLKTKIVQVVRDSGKDPENKFKGSNMWLKGFKERRGVSHQRKTNNKSKSVEERLPQIKNFHWWAIYQMALEDP